MPRIRKRTQPGAVDDDAMKRARDRKKAMEKMGASNRKGEYMNPVDAASEELEYDEPESVRRIFES